MNIKKLYNKVEYIFKNKELCTININDSESEITGYILDYNNDFLLLQAIYDFVFDGYRIVPFKQISHFVYNNTKRHLSKICKSEGIIPHNDFALSCNISNFDTIFKYLFENEKYIALTLINSIHSFVLGKIVGIYNECIEIKLIDGAGEWQDETSFINYNEITSVIFNDDYIKYMSKYAH